MDCGKFSSMIEEYLDGALSRQEEQAFLEHEKECEACRAQLQLAREAAELMRELREEAPDFIAPAMKKIAAQRRAKHRAFAALASTAAVLLVSCVFLLQTPGGKSAMPQSAPDTAQQENGLSGAGTPQEESGESYFSDEGSGEDINEKSMARDMGQVLRLSPQQAEQLDGLLSQEQKQALEPEPEGSFLPLTGQEAELLPLLKEIGIEVAAGEYGYLFLPGVK